MPKLIDLTGQRFGRLTVVERAVNKRNSNTRWLCQCDCGKILTVQGSSLRSGSTQSCGCYRIEIASENLPKMQRQNVLHGQSKSNLFRVWTAMRYRCKNPKAKSFSNYGGRGISVCAEWDTSFAAFYNWAMTNGYAENLTIDRIDNNGNYSPENCRWVSVKEQLKNRRKTRFLTYAGKTMTIVEWAELYGMDYNVLFGRLQNGWSVERALMEPVHTKFSHKKE